MILALIKFGFGDDDSFNIEILSSITLESKIDGNDVTGEEIEKNIYKTEK